MNIEASSRILRQRTSVDLRTTGRERVGSINLADKREQSKTNNHHAPPKDIKCPDGENTHKQHERKPTNLAKYIGNSAKVSSSACPFAVVVKFYFEILNQARQKIFADLLVG